MQIVPLLWKAPVVTGAVAVGAIGANQAAWSGADLVVNSPLMGMFEDFIAGIFFSLGVAVSVSSFLLVRKIAKPALWLMVPIFLYAAIVLGVWNGFASDFDGTRLEARRHHYVLENMSPRGRFRSCDDGQIDLTDDAKAVCERLMNANPGDRIPGSEHRCGLLRMFSCFNTAPER
jgi:hypothetical protein